MPIHLSGKRTGEISLTDAVVPPGGDGGLHLRNTGAAAARALLINTLGTFDKFVSVAGVKLGQNQPADLTPDAQPAQKILELAEEFGVKILVPPRVPARQ